MTSNTQDDLDIKLTQLVESVVNIRIELYKKPVHYGNGIFLYPTDIHIIEIVGTEGGKNVTEVAKCLGLSKGTVSRRLSGLEEKGYVEKYISSTNDKEKYIRLTDRGLYAYDCHQQYHTKSHTLLDDNDDSFSSREKLLMISCFEKLKRNYELLMEEADNYACGDECESSK